MAQMGFYVDMNHCSGCRCCQVACKDKNDVSVGAFFREVFDFEGDAFPDTWAASLSLGCNHCETPQCAKNCPVAALAKQEDSGLVIQNREMCIGCGKCIVSCPYGAPSYDAEKDTVGKCDGCITLLEAHEAPACVAACSTRCLKFGELQALLLQFPDVRLTKDLTCLPQSSLTNPSLLIVPKKEMIVAETTVEQIL